MQRPEDSIPLTATDNHPARDSRLLDAFRLAACHLLRSVIEALKDAKGTLVVTWTRQPTEAERAAFALAWEALGEPGENVRHVVAGQSEDA